MNSDPYDSAAWRTFGMLDPDESAIFDEAMRHDPLLRSAYREMDRISAAIAAATTPPLAPKPGQLERLYYRLNLNRSKRGYLWLGISGWAAAAVLAIALLLDRTGTLQRPQHEIIADTAATPGKENQVTTPPRTEVPETTTPQTPKSPEDRAQTAAATGKPASIAEPDGKTTAKVETKRLVQEIEVLRENLEKFQHRDQVLFEAVPGMALPIVMRMNPPGLAADESSTLANTDEHSPITAMLGDALRVMTTTSTGTPDTAPDAMLAADPPAIPQYATAIPIYDAARDSGTLVVSNLPAAEKGEVYNLWVKTEAGAKPIYVGSLPESSATGADSFDFSLGSTMVFPSGFVLTKDPQDTPTTPTGTNTVLQGPPTPSR